MHVTRLSLTHFRSYENLELTFQPGVNTFIGNNGCGKTNIVEALIYLGFLSSHRVSTNTPLIYKDRDQAIIVLKLPATIDRWRLTLKSIHIKLIARGSIKTRLNRNERFLARYKLFISPLKI